MIILKFNIDSLYVLDTVLNIIYELTHSIM